MSKTSIRQSGFTLIELVITIVVVAIMVMGIAGFIELGTKGYVDTVDRQQLQNQARFAVEKSPEKFAMLFRTVLSLMVMIRVIKVYRFIPLTMQELMAICPTVMQNSFSLWSLVPDLLDKSVKSTWWEKS